MGVIVATVVGGVLTVVALHYIKVGLRRWLKKDKISDDRHH